MTIEFDIPSGINPEKFKKYIIEGLIKLEKYFPGTYDTKGNKIYVTTDNPIDEITAQPIIQNLIDKLKNRRI